MTDFPPFSQLLSRAPIQAQQMRCLTFSRVNQLRNGESSKVGEYIQRTLYNISRATLKVLLCCFLINIQSDMAWSFQMSYYSSPQIKGLQSCDLSKFEVQKKGLPGSYLNKAESDLLNKISFKFKMSDFFQTSNFDKSQFCSPLTYEDAQQLF